VRQLRQNSPLDPGGDRDVRRPLFEQIPSSQPVPADALVEKADRAGVTALSVTISAAPQPVPTGAVFVSPWIDLTLTGDSMTTRASVNAAVDR
jgi:hypothetical protein